jgi:hypothetical protein
VAEAASSSSAESEGINVASVVSAAAEAAKTLLADNDDGVEHEEL